MANQFDLDVQVKKTSGASQADFWTNSCFCSISCNATCGCQLTIGCVTNKATWCGCA
ncbi:FDLD family class I lanthipeptide [Paenibacillus sp. SI8]|uniref:FDLD family class I lanthipeptide n=1 Tax=unclassified Paenibacillus TaxID=185978 RepID=UPI00346536BC